MNSTIPGDDINFGYDQLPSQKKLHESDAKWKAMFGGFGSGKTKWLCYEALRHCIDEPKNLWVLLRKTYPELDDTLKKDFLEEICPAGVIAYANHTKRDYRLVTGSWILFRSFDELSKIFSYNLGGFGIDQAEELPESYFLGLISRCRRAGINKRVGVLSLNPAGHNWVWRRFIRDGKDDPDFDYAIARSEENIHLPPGYVDMLRKIFPPPWVARYVDCEFDEFEGLVYSSFRDTGKGSNVISKLPGEPKEQPYNMVVIDVGVDAPMAVLFAYFDIIERKLIVYDEIYESGLTVQQISSLIKARLKRWGLETRQPWKWLIDPDALKRQIAGRKVKPISIIQDFRSHGIPVQKADNAVGYGILRVNELFQRRMILIYDKLKHFFDEIYDYIYAPKKGVITGDINSPGIPLDRKNHLMDCLRYLILGLPISWTMPGEEVEDIWQKHFANRFGGRKRKLSQTRLFYKGRDEKIDGIGQQAPRRWERRGVKKLVRK